MGHWGEYLQVHRGPRLGVLGAGFVVASYALLSATWLYLSVSPEEALYRKAQAAEGCLVFFSLAMNMAMAGLIRETAKSRPFVIRLAFCICATLGMMMCILIILGSIHAWTYL